MFCVKCGALAANDEMKFCLECGAPLPTPTVAAPPASTATPPAVKPPSAARPEAAPPSNPPPASTQPAASAPPAPLPPKSGNTFLKIVVVVLGFLALCAAIGIGSCIYIGYRVKRKAEQFTTDLKKEMGQARNGSGQEGTVSIQPCPAVDPSQSQAFRTAAASASIPLKPGLTLVDVYTNQRLKGRDVEVLKSVQAIDDNTVTIQAARAEPGSKSSTRILCVADLLNARQYVTGFGTNMPETISGTTMFTMSQAVFQDWKAAHPAELAYFQASKSGADRYRVDSNVKGELSRAEPDDVPYSIIVNGERKDLPTIHVKGQLGGKAAEAFVLDDAANPITLSWAIPDWNFHVKYVKITFPVEKKIEQDLAERGRAEIYGIYFDFDSAKLRPESGPVLNEIADALQHQPNWKLQIEGHTDNVGGDAYNLDLSRRRAEAVKQALVSQYHISADRLGWAGFGASRPKASNDTVEGRALNRRVELVRE